MRKPQAQIVKKWGKGRPGYIDERAFLHSDGSVTALTGYGVSHSMACVYAHTTIERYFRSGGVRILIHSGICSIEAWTEKFTFQQLSVIKGTIKRGDFRVVRFAINKKVTDVEDFQRVTVAGCKEALSC